MTTYYYSILQAFFDSSVDLYTSDDFNFPSEAMKHALDMARFRGYNNVTIEVYDITGKLIKRSYFA